MFKSSKNYTGYTVQISKKGEIRLKRPSGRTIGWCMKPSDVDGEARLWLEIYSGASLDDRRNHNGELTAKEKTQ